MPLRQFDAQLLDDLLALGGHALRDQFLSDLARCATQMRDCSAGTRRNDAPAPEQVKRGLHELRGIAVTIGATRLSAYCLETETGLFQTPDATTRSRYATIATACDALRASILSRRIDQA